MTKKEVNELVKKAKTLSSEDLRSLLENWGNAKPNTLGAIADALQIVFEVCGLNQSIARLLANKYFAHIIEKGKELMAKEGNPISDGELIETMRGNFSWILVEAKNEELEDFWHEIMEQY